MKNYKSKNNFFRLTLLSLLICVMSMLSLSFSYRKVTSDLWNQLGIDEGSGLEQVKRSFLEGYFYHGRAKVLSGDKVAIANDLLKYAKAYVNSSAFKEAYELERENRKPVSDLPEGPKTKEQLQQKLIMDTKQAIAQYEQMIPQMPAESRESLKEGMDALKEQLTSYEDPENPMLDYMAQNEQMVYEATSRKHVESLKKWEGEYPANHHQFIKKRLEKFLELTRDVDYSAALKEQYGKMRFVNPVYEQKPAEWKMAYRSGKEVTETARTFARQWLNEIK